ncbi:MAG: tail fiber protein [Aquamicrobium sp.]|uniref:tail fiber protein n=1 Tax=Aquamicrobium sp. TaxID=1872579 RepID=UPI00349EF775|nr:tail fiber protein [Aquamicrobium sp.]
MPRNSSGLYNLPPGTRGQPNTTIKSGPYNTFVGDIEQDLNTPRPITAGGTGATNAQQALTNLGGVSIAVLESMFTGIVAFFAMPDAPGGWLVCDGREVSRSTYSRLFAAIGTTWGAGNGVSTFNLPDLRGEFIRGADLGRGVDPDRAFASSQGSDNKEHTHTGEAVAGGSHNHPYSVVGLTGGATLQGYVSGAGWAAVAVGDTTTTAGIHTHVLTISEEGGDEARPRNVAMLPCIKD